MSAPKFTPGPLTVVPGDSVLNIMADNRRVAVVGSVNYWERHSLEDAANAYLYAASPDLYEALEAINTFRVFFRSHIPPGLGNGAREALDMASAALAKARGDGG